MKILFLFVSLFTFFSMDAQTSKTNSWKIFHNSKLRLQATAENETKNSFTIKAADLKKKGQVTIQYTEPKKQKDWKRTITAFNESDAELVTADGYNLNLDNAKLRALAAEGIKTINIYTWALPTDPELASRIRIRRAHVATIKLVP